MLHRLPGWLRRAIKKAHRLYEEFPRLVCVVIPGLPTNIHLRDKATILLRDEGIRMSIYNYGKVTSWRIKTFFSKEPDTLRWLRNINEENAVFFDVGANIGLYAIYAGLLGIKTVAFEPFALNFAQLCLNICENKCGERVKAYPLAIHSEESMSELNLSSLEWGSALSSFDNTIDQFGKEYTPVYKQGVMGISLDRVCSMIGYYPTHLKIDVDGNEGLLLKGAQKVLKDSVRSMIIELSELREDYSETVALIESYGLKLVEAPSPNLVSEGGAPVNHRFERIPEG